jgi:DNA-binding transcriptional regulator YiaG
MQYPLRGNFRDSSIAYAVHRVYTDGMEPAELTRRREALGLSRAELADLIGVNSATVWRWEEGRFNPSGLALRQLETTLRRLERRRPTTGAAEGAE